MFYFNIISLSVLFFSINYLIGFQYAKELKSDISNYSSSVFPTEKSSTDKSDYIMLMRIFVGIYFTGIIATFSLYVLITDNYRDIQQFIVLAISGFANVFAGLILFKVLKWTSFVNIKGLLVLVPSLMGLKGNLEMTMASRLSTLANIGDHMDSWKNTFNIIIADMVLVQCQATVVSFFAALVVIIAIPSTINNSILLCAISLTTANITCFLLGILLAGVVVSANKLGYDPDDLATPIAASLGDLSTLLIMAYYSQFLYETKPLYWLPIEATIIIIIFIICEPILLFMSYKNDLTRDILIHGWTPIILSMLISAIGGLILNDSTEKFKKLSTFQPVFNGFAGNCVALQASRISTSLHRSGPIGTITPSYRICVSPYFAFCSNDNINVRTAKILLLFVAIPSQIAYLLVIRIVQETDKFEITLPFISLYIVFSFIEVALLLYMAYNLIHLIWKLGHDPDLNAIPILTALGDFFGTLLLFLEFKILDALNDINAKNE